MSDRKALVLDVCNEYLAASKMQRQGRRRLTSNDFWVSYVNPYTIRFVIQTPGLSTDYEVPSDRRAADEIYSRLMGDGFQADMDDIQAAIEAG